MMAIKMLAIHFPISLFLMQPKINDATFVVLALAGNDFSRDYQDGGQ